MSNIRVPYGMDGVACAWPGIEANIAELQARSVPEPSIWTLPRERTPQIVQEKRAASIAESLSLLEIGQARVVYAVSTPNFFMRQASAIAGAYEARKAPDHGKNAWIVERVA